jgi:myo-inositol-1-phosphate synthase
MTREAGAPRTGVWLVGARGAVATTTLVGLLAARRGMVPLRGVTTSGPRGEGLALVGPSGLVPGGWEPAPGSLAASAAALAASRVFDTPLVGALAEDLAAVDADIVTGGTAGFPAPDGRRDGDEAPAAALARLRADLDRFRRRHALARVVVVNLASTEPAWAPSAAHASLAALEAAIAGDGDAAVLRPSTLYACAALLEGAAFVNFAASPAALVPAVWELAEREGVPFAGTDGKTGETLVKSALAPLFRERELRVLGWHGANVLGNADGASLRDPEVRAAKVASKDGVVPGVLGYAPHTSVDITYVPALGDWKTAWDLVHFEGFLGTRMTMQFTWQGADSILAAPLVIDLVRLADLALRRGERGPMRHAACFFKMPVGTGEHDLARQYAMLDRYLDACRAASGRAGAGRRSEGSAGAGG